MTTQTQTRSETISHGEEIDCGYLRERDPLTFRADSVLVGRGVKDATGSWTQEHDHWSVTLHETLYGGTMTFDYRSGTGHRDSRGTPEAPDTADVLTCIGSDLGTAAEMGSTDGEAMDYLVGELGMSGKPSEILTTVQALRKHHADAKAMLSNTGMDVEHFADWCRSLDV